MNKTAESDLSYQNRLFIIDEKLLTYKSIISYQKDEILKTELTIKQYVDHLDRQNEALNLYLEEEEELKQMKENIIKYKECLLNENNIIEDVQKLSEESTQEVTIIETSQKIDERNSQQFEKNLDVQKLSEENTDDVMIIETPQKINKRNSQQFEKSVKQLTNNISTLSIAEINNETVYSMKVHGDNIFIGCSNGVLVRNIIKRNIIFETHTNKSILQIEMMKIKSNLSLYALTKEAVIFYKNIKEPQFHRHIDLPGIEYAFKRSNQLFIPVSSGFIHQFDMYECTIKTLILPNNECVSSIAISYKKTNFSLAVLRNGLLYKCMVTKFSLNNFEQVEGVEDLRRVLRIVNLGYVYYSDTTIWIVDNNLKHVKSKKIENGIKFVEVYNNYLVVVDHDNTLHIYEFNYTKYLKLCTQRISGDISAVTITTEKVYLFIENEIFVIKYI